MMLPHVKGRQQQSGEITNLQGIENYFRKEQNGIDACIIIAQKGMEINELVSSIQKAVKNR